MGYIYKISSSCSNKVYIGKTIYSIQERFSKHIYDAKNGKQSHLYNAMRKYGIDTFKIEEVEECDDNILSEREQYWIKYYDSFNNGYNMTIGGEGNPLYTLEDYQIIANKLLKNGNIEKTAKELNISQHAVRRALQKINIPYQRKIGNVEYIIKDYLKLKDISEVCKKHHIGHEALNKILKDFNVEKVHKTQFRPTKEQELEILQKYREGYTQLEIAAMYHTTDDLIRRVMRDYNEPVIQGRRVPIYQIDRNTKEIINCFPTIKNASNSMGLKSDSSIHNAANNFPNKSSAGFLWLRVRDKEKLEVFSKC